jgi:hypothetical protein
MPEAISYELSMTSDAWRALEDAYAAEIKSRQKAIKRGWAYYEGDHDLPLKIQKDGYNDNVVVNHVEALADRLTAFLIGDGVRFDAGGDDTQTATDDAIELLWQKSRGAILQESIALSGAIEGHCAVRLVPRQGLPTHITRIKQAHFAAFWDAMDMERVLWYRLQYVSGKVGKRLDYVRGQVIDNEIVDHDAPGWAEIVYELKDRAPGVAADSHWIQTINPAPWPYDWPPVVDWQNLPSPNAYYGKSDITSAIKLNDALNFILSNMQRIIKHHASPKTVGTGWAADQLVETSVGGLLTVPQADAKIYNLEMQSDLGSSQNLASIIAAGLWQSGGMVDPQTMKDRVGTLTNFGLRVLFADAIKRTEKKRLLYGEAFEQIAQRGLMLAGQAAPETVATVWPDVLPTDDTVEVTTLGQELEMGIISKETYRTKRGYDNEKEQDLIADEGTTGDIGTRILEEMNANKPFNKGTTGDIGGPTPATEAAPSNLESTQGLNGIQIKAALDILDALTAGRLTKEAAVELLVAMGMDRAAANLIVSTTAKLPPADASVAAPATPDAAAILARLKKPGV